MSFRQRFAVILLLVASAAAAQDAGTRAIPYHWEPIDGAGGYLIEVADDSQTIVATEQAPAGATSVALSLAPGQYQIRLTPLDITKNPQTPGDWTPFPVEAVKPPVLVSMEPSVLISGVEGTARLQLEGLADGATASVRSPSGNLFPVEISQTDTVLLKVPALEETGNYTLLVTNPPDQTLTVKGKLTVRYPQPVVKQVSPDTLEPTGADQSLELTGENFSSEAIVGVRAGDGGKLVLLAITSRSPTSIQVVVPKDLGPGEYRLMLANGLRERQILAGSLKIKAPPVPVKKVEKEKKPSRRAELQTQIDVLKERIRTVDAQNLARRTVGWVSLGLGLAGTATGALLYSRADPAPFSSDGQVGTAGGVALSTLSVGLSGLLIGAVILTSDDAAPLRLQLADLERQLLAES